MLVPVLLFIVGLLFLIKGGDWFVDGASALARRFHLPELLIGATVVSIGTTLPEVMVSTMSAVSGHGEIAYGNAIGSVICNSALIAAITIAVRPGKVDPKTLKTPVIFFFIAAAIYCVAAYGFGEFTRPMGFIMLAMFVAYMVANVRQMKNAPAEEHAEEEELIPLSKTLILLVAGAALIAVGANLLVDNGTLIAQALGVPESVIALTFVALGTSLPELVTAITSLIKGHSDLSVGNVVGANVFNLVLVSGIDQAVDVANAYAAEHLEIQTADASTVARRIRNAGAVFVGDYAPVPLGDYSAGSTHVLPTGSAARYSSGLTVRSFMKSMHIIEYSREGLAAIADGIVDFAHAERLPGHAAAIQLRVEEER